MLAEESGYLFFSPYSSCAALGTATAGAASRMAAALPFTSAPDWLTAAFNPRAKLLKSARDEARRMVGRDRPPTIASAVATPPGGWALAATIPSGIPAR